MEEPLLNGGAVIGCPTAADYEPVKNFKEAKSVFWTETVKLWKIAAPIVFNILCNYGTNSFTNIFVGHIGEIELSSVTISLSVIGTFSFGFMVSSLLTFLIYMGFFFFFFFFCFVKNLYILLF